ncbi:hypothetical protein TIFTF001_016436 [Ficus carica]|uniref:Leucine-rich repeat-containing N-terminal plant-type domain-containing protein n=1 Tax=Ficus carica TaxID=3494 RepID=A0AA88A349_FICCA|nr:hypothetical protein TIFTF001_016436 [Ficus carica]
MNLRACQVEPKTSDSRNRLNNPSTYLRSTHRKIGKLPRFIHAQESYKDQSKSRKESAKGYFPFLGIIIRLKDGVLISDDPISHSIFTRITPKEEIFAQGKREINGNPPKSPQFRHFHPILSTPCNLSLFPAIPISILPILTAMAFTTEASLSLRSSIGFDLPNPLPTWSQTSTPCNWTGVLCNQFGQGVVSLDLFGFRLSGSISPHIGNLSFLQSLYLQNNLFTGPIPREITNLSRLRVVNMSSNLLQDVLPPNMTSLTKIEVLDLMSNRITGEVPKVLSLLTKLELFTGMSPTHESFTVDLNPQRRTQSSFQENLVKVIDSELPELGEALYHQGYHLSRRLQFDCLATVIEMDLLALQALLINA